MRNIILSLAIFCTIQGSAQETTQKISRTDGDQEIFFVLKSDKTIRHGLYRRLNAYDMVLTEGHFTNGKKDSIWTDYWGPSLLKARGEYVQDERSGVWSFYSRKGVLEQQYDYTSHRVIDDESFHRNKEKKFRVISGKDTIETQLQSPPVYIGGRTKMQSVLTKGMRFPTEAIRNNVTGDVLIRFYIDKDGKVFEPKVIKGLGYGCDEECLRLCKQIADNWYPALLNGEKVVAEFILPVRFQSLF